MFGCSILLKRHARLALRTRAVNRLPLAGLWLTGLLALDQTPCFAQDTAVASVQERDSEFLDGLTLLLAPNAAPSEMFQVAENIRAVGARPLLVFPEGFIIAQLRNCEESDDLSAFGITDVFNGAVPSDLIARAPVARAQWLYAWNGIKDPGWLAAVSALSGPFHGVCGRMGTSESPSSETDLPILRRLHSNYLIGRVAVALVIVQGPVPAPPGCVEWVWTESQVTTLRQFSIYQLGYLVDEHARDGKFFILEPTLDVVNIPGEPTCEADYHTWIRYAMGQLGYGDDHTEDRVASFLLQVRRNLRRWTGRSSARWCAATCTPCSPGSDAVAGRWGWRTE